MEKKYIIPHLRNKNNNITFSEREAKRVNDIETELPWIVFQSNKENIDNFLCKYKPSIIQQDEFAWISITNPNILNIVNTLENIELAENKWKYLQKLKNHVNLNDINEIAKSCNIISGKWLIYIKTELVDEIWNKIAHCCIKGLLGCSIKVSPKSINTISHVICVYTNNYFDINDVKKVRNVLKEIGIIQSINYKPDIFTYLCIYRKNKWNIKPSIYATRIKKTYLLF